MGGKDQTAAENGGYNVLQGGIGQYVADPTMPTATATSGSTEPSWPTGVGAQVYDAPASAPFTPTVITVTTALTNDDYLCPIGGTTGIEVGMVVSCDGSYYEEGTTVVGVDVEGQNALTSNPCILPTEFVGPVTVTFTSQAPAGPTGITWTAILARVIDGVVTEVLNPATFQHNLGQYPSHYFQYGVVLWLTGDNAGFQCDIRDSLGPVSGPGGTSPPYIMGLEIAPNPIQVGDTFQATVGCGKIRIKCQDFNNLDNYRGFPDMPTEERALATPNVSNQGYAPSNVK